MPTNGGGDASFEFTTNLFQLEKEMERALERLSRATGNVKGPDLAPVTAAMRKIDAEVSQLQSKLSEINSATHSRIAGAAVPGGRGSVNFSEKDVFSRQLNDAAQKSVGTIETIFKDLAKSSPAQGAALRDYVHTSLQNVGNTLNSVGKEYAQGLKKAADDAKVDLIRTSKPKYSALGQDVRAGASAITAANRFNKTYGGDEYEKVVARSFRNAARNVQTELVKGLSPKAQEYVRTTAATTPGSTGLGDFAGASKKVVAELRTFERKFNDLEGVAGRSVTKFRDLSAVLDRAAQSSKADTAASKAQTASGASGGTTGGGKGGGKGGGTPPPAAPASPPPPGDGGKSKKQAADEAALAKQASLTRQAAIRQQLEADKAFTAKAAKQAGDLDLSGRGDIRPAGKGRYYDASTESRNPAGERVPNSGTVFNAKTGQPVDDQIAAQDAVATADRAIVRAHQKQAQDADRAAKAEGTRADQAEAQLEKERQANAQRSAAIGAANAKAPREAAIRRTENVRRDTTDPNYPRNFLTGEEYNLRAIGKKFYYNAATERQDRNGQAIPGTGEVRTRNNNQLVRDTTELNDLQLRYLNEEIRLAKARGAIDDQAKRAISQRNALEQKEFERTGRLGGRPGEATTRDTIEAEIRKAGSQLTDLGRDYYKNQADPAGTYRYKNTGLTVQPEGTNYAAAVAAEIKASRTSGAAPLNGPFEERLTAQAERARAARLAGDPAPAASLRAVNRNTVYSRSQDSYFDRRTGVELERGSQQLTQAMSDDTNVLARMAGADRERLALTELTNNVLRGQARRLSGNLYTDESNGQTRFASLTSNGARYLDNNRDALRVQQAQELQDRSQPRTARQGFVSGLTSSGFGGTNGDFNVAGLAQAAGTTVKYTALYDAINAVQQIATYAAQEILNYADSVRNLEQAAGDSLGNMTAFDSALAEIAQGAGINLGDAYDQAAIGMRAFGQAVTDTAGNVTELTAAQKQQVALGFTSGVRTLALLTGDTYDQSSTNLRAAASADPAAFAAMDDQGRNNVFAQVNDAVYGANQLSGGDRNDIAQGLGALASAAKQAGFSYNETANLISAGTAQLGESGTLYASRFSRILSIFGGTSGKKTISDINDGLDPGQKINTSASTRDQLFQLAKIFPTLESSQQSLIQNKLGGTTSPRELLNFFANAQKAGANTDYTGLAAQTEADLENTLPRLITRASGAGSELITQGLIKSEVIAPLIAGIKLGTEALEFFGQGVETLNSKFTDLENKFGFLDIFNGHLRGAIATVVAFAAAMKIASFVRNSGGLGALATGRALAVEKAVNPQNAYFRSLNQANDATAAAAKATAAAAPLMARTATAAEAAAARVAPTTAAAPGVTRGSRDGVGQPLRPSETYGQSVRRLQAGGLLPGSSPLLRSGDPRLQGPDYRNFDRLTRIPPATSIQNAIAATTGITRQAGNGPVATAEAAARRMEIAALQVRAQSLDPEAARLQRDARMEGLRGNAQTALTNAATAKQAQSDATRERTSARQAFARLPKDSDAFTRSVATERLAAADKEATRAINERRTADRALTQSQNALRAAGGALGAQQVSLRGIFRNLGSDISNVAAAGKGARLAYRGERLSARDAAAGINQTAAQAQLRNATTEAARTADEARQQQAVRDARNGTPPAPLRNTPNELDRAAQTARFNSGVRAAEAASANAQTNLAALRAQRVDPDDTRAVAARGTNLATAQSEVLRTQQQLARLQAVSPLVNAPADTTTQAQNGATRAAEQGSRGLRGLSGSLRESTGRLGESARSLVANSRGAQFLSRQMGNLSLRMGEAAVATRAAASAAGGSALANAARSFTAQGVAAFRDLKQSLSSGFGLLLVATIGVGLVKSAANARKELLNSRDEQQNFQAYEYTSGGLSSTDQEDQINQLKQNTARVEEASKGFFASITEFFNSKVGTQDSTKDLTQFAKLYASDQTNQLNRVKAYEADPGGVASGDLAFNFSSIDDLKTSVDDMQAAGLSASDVFDTFVSQFSAFNQAASEGVTIFTDAQKSLIANAAANSLLQTADQTFRNQRYAFADPNGAKLTNDQALAQSGNTAPYLVNPDGSEKQGTRNSSGAGSFVTPPKQGTINGIPDPRVTTSSPTPSTLGKIELQSFSTQALDAQTSVAAKTQNSAARTALAAATTAEQVAAAAKGLDPTAYGSTLSDVVGLQRDKAKVNAGFPTNTGGLNYPNHFGDGNDRANGADYNLQSLFTRQNVKNNPVDNVYETDASKKANKSNNLKETLRGIFSYIAGGEHFQTNLSPTANTVQLAANSIELSASTTKGTPGFGVLAPTGPTPTAATDGKTTLQTLASSANRTDGKLYDNNGNELVPTTGDGGLRKFGDSPVGSDGKPQVTVPILANLKDSVNDVVLRFLNQGGDPTSKAGKDSLRTTLTTYFSNMFTSLGLSQDGVQAQVDQALQAASETALGEQGTNGASFNLSDIGARLGIAAQLNAAKAQDQGTLASLGVAGSKQFGTLDPNLIKGGVALDAGVAEAQAKLTGDQLALSQARTSGENYINQKYTDPTQRKEQLALLERYLGAQKIIVAQDVKALQDASVASLQSQAELAAATIPDSNSTASLQAQLKTLQDVRGKLTETGALRDNLTNQIKAAAAASDSAFQDSQSSGLADIDPQNSLERARVEAANARARLQRVQNGYDVDAAGNTYQIDPQSRTKAEADARDAAANADAAYKSEQRESLHAQRVSQTRPEDLVGLANEQVRYTTEQVEYLRIHAYGTAAYFNAVEANEQAIVDAQQKQNDLDYASKLAKIDPRAGSSRAQAALDKASADLKLIKVDTQAYYEKQAEIIQDMINLAESQAQEASNARKLTIDLTNPVATAQEELTKAQSAYDAAVKQLDAQGITDPAERAKVLDPLKVDVLNSQANEDQQAFQQRLSDIQIADRLGRVSHSAYLGYLRGEHDRLTQQLAGMKTTDQMYRQYVDQLNTVDEALKAAKDSLNQMYNLQDVTIPTIYEVRRAVGASADQIRSQVVDYSSTQGTVIINGADMATVIQYVNKVLGTGSTSVYTTSPRRV